MAKTLGTGTITGLVNQLVGGKKNGAVLGALSGIIAIQRTQQDLRGANQAAQPATDPAALRQEQMRTQSTDLAQSIRESTAAWGLSGDALAIFRLRQEGATAAMLSAANAAMAQRQTLEGIFAANVRTGSVFQDASVRLGALTRAFQEGRLSQEAFAAGSRKLKEDLDK